MGRDDSRPAWPMRLEHGVAGVLRHEKRRYSDLVEALPYWKGALTAIHGSKFSIKQSITKQPLLFFNVIY